jgi:hypothetical protein
VEGHAIRSPPTGGSFQARPDNPTTLAITLSRPRAFTFANYRPTVCNLENREAKRPTLRSDSHQRRTNALYRQSSMPDSSTINASMVSTSLALRPNATEA